MALIRVLSRLALIFVTVVLVAFVVFNYGSFLVTVPALDFRYWVGAADSIRAPETPLFVFCAGFFVLGVVLMGLASMQVYLDLAGSWRKLRKERKSYEPERRELERARAALAREREDYEPKRRELDFRSSELDHRADELKRDREAIAEARNHLASERAELARERAEVGGERNAVERERTSLEAARTTLARDRAHAESVIARASAMPAPAPEPPCVEMPGAVSSVAAPELASAGTVVADPSSAEPDWDLAERLDDDVAAVARLAREDLASEPANEGEGEGDEPHATERVDPDESR